MIKIRYFNLRLPKDVELVDLAEAARTSENTPSFKVVKVSSNELIAVLTTVRELRTVQYLADGSIVPGTATTMEQYSVRIFRVHNQFFLSLLDPPRSSKIVTDFLDLLVGGRGYFIEALEFSRSSIERHMSEFESVKLVSAKVRDFQVYEKAVARLEVTSKEGLPEEIAPFLAGKFHRIDSMTYEVIYQFKKGLINYSANGTVRISAPLVEYGFQSFERLLEARA